MPVRAYRNLFGHCWEPPPLTQPPFVYRALPNQPARLEVKGLLDTIGNLLWGPVLGNFVQYLELASRQLRFGLTWTPDVC